MAELAIPALIAATSAGVSYGATTLAQKRQEDALEKEKRRLGQIEEGQRRARDGGRGLLSFADEDPKGSKTLGGSGGGRAGARGLLQIANTSSFGGG